MPPPLGLSGHPNPIHLYRSLLREATYLPPACRNHIEPRIRLRFRNHRRDPAPSSRLRRASHGLRYLRAANRGDLVRMRRIVMMAFGRIGWRRQELMGELRLPEQPSSSAQLAERLAEAGPVSDWLDRWNTEKLLAFAKSQSQHKLHNSPRPQVNPKRLDPAEAVPPVNSWGRPFVPKVARSKLKKWWKSLAHRVLPPLPRGEWELLRKLATGQVGAEWTAPPARAVARAGPGPVADVLSGWDWERYATRPIRAVDRPRSRRFRVSFAADRDVPVSLYDGPAIGIHRYTPRLWRRLYAEIWQMSATMEPRTDKAGGGWTITWGGMPTQLLQPTAASLEFFEGVDSKGNVPRPPGETARREVPIRTK